MEGNINEEVNERVNERGLSDIGEQDERDERDEQEFLDSDVPEFDEDEVDNSQEDDELPDYGGMEQNPLGGIYGLFKEVLGREDSKKVSFLTNEELGSFLFNVRDCENIALLAKTFNHPGVASYFVDRSRIITDTAMSRNGNFVQLFVTSKKYAARDTSSSIQNLPQFQKKNKWKIFSKKEDQQVTNNP